MEDLRAALLAGPILCDGAMGSLIYERGVFLNSCFEEANLSRPDLIRKIHEDYRIAGADLLSTNTYAANRFRLAEHDKAGMTAAIVRAGVAIARDAAGDECYVGGSVGPTGLDVANLTPAERLELRAGLAEQINVLIDEGVDAIMLETFNSIDEILMAIEVAREHDPASVIFAQMAFGNDRRTLEGLTPETVSQRLAAAGADVIGVNCSDGPGLVFEVAERMLEAGKPVSAQPNAGRPEMHEGRTIYVANPEYFGVFARRLLKRGISVIGGCCGTRPEHIQRMAQAVRMMGGSGTRRRAEAVAERVARGGIAATPIEERSHLGAALGKEFVVSVEINPPLGFDGRALHDAAKRLRDAGINAINVADGPRASARMGNLAFAVELERATGMETILHVCGRDRSLLGQIAHLLGAHYLGLRNLVLITGDPPKVGDYPESTGVYDLDAIGLLRMAADMNHGLDPAGKSIQESTRFLLATGAEPGALDHEREIHRLFQKREAGAELVMTQPVYDHKTLERFLGDTRDLGLPIMLGLLPLASARNAEFLHANVPGMVVPDAVRSRMAAARTAEAARAEGIAIAREMLEAARDRIQGAYIMPPLGRYDAAIDIVKGIVGGHVAEVAAAVRRS